jgi:hypothetical protein
VRGRAQGALDAGLRRRLLARVRAALGALGRRRSSACLVLTDDEEIRTLNRTYRKHDRATDVLSFHLQELAGEGDPAGDGIALGDLAIGRLYVRLFDVDWDHRENAARPVAPLALGGDGGVPATVQVVPVVFIRERALRHLDAGGIAALAENIWRKVGDLVARIGRRATELQIDCDWTDATRDRYFALLTAVGARARPAGTTLGATIRLHQVKYRERTGVPPVARGMLMFYSMGRIDAEAGTNAIFDPAVAQSYLGRVGDYPLPLDVALPIWSWVIHVRGGEVEGLLQDTDPTRLGDKPWLAPRGAGRFEVTETSFLNGVLLRKGDFLDTEVTTGATTRVAAEMIAARLSAGRRPGTVALFHLSDRSLANHETKDLVRVFDRFR